jgi:ABC-type Na+ efflux pump permease subunit
MTLFPIVNRELRVAARRPGTYWTRFSAVMLALLVGSIVWSVSLRSSPRETGLAMFVGLAIITYIYSFCAGVISTADSVSEEKREGTLGLLFLTDLRPYDIVLGKLVASSVHAFYGLLAIFPVMAVPLLLGGVTLGEFGRVALTCVNLSLLSLTVGLLASTLCKDERKATGLTLVTLLVLSFGWPGIVAWLASHSRPGNLFYDLMNHQPEALMMWSPAFPCVYAFEDPYTSRGGSGQWYFASLGVSHGLAWLCLWLTMRILPRVWQDKGERPRLKTLQAGPTALVQSADDARRQFRRAALSINPVYWLAARQRFKFVLVWLVLLVCALLWLWGLAKERQYWLTEATYLFTAVSLHSLMKLWMAFEASRQFGEDRRTGALELLLSTPLQVEQILRGQWRALVAQFGLPCAVICLVDVTFLSLGARNSNAEDFKLWLWVWLIGITSLVLDLVTIACVAMWRSLVQRKPGRAAGNAIVLVCVVPWLLYAVITTAFGIMEMVFGYRLSHLLGDVTGWSLLGLWAALSLGVDILLLRWSVRNLRRRFRQVATERLESKPSILARWFGRKPAAQS